MIEFILMAAYAVILSTIIGLIIFDKRLFKFRQYTLVTAILIPLLVVSGVTIYFNYETFKGLPRRTQLPIEFWLIHAEFDEDNDRAYYVIRLDNNERVYYTEKYNKEKRKKIEEATRLSRQGSNKEIRITIKSNGEFNVNIINRVNLPRKTHESNSQE